jgi:hypothetical protein
MIFAVRLSMTQSKKRGSVFLQGTYVGTDNQTYTLVDNGTRVVTGVLESRDRVQTYILNPDKVQEFKIDDEKASSLAVLKFLKNHPSVKCEGYDNPNVKGEQMFELFIEHEKEQADYRRLQELCTVLDVVRDMSENEMRDLSFVLGGDPRGKSARSVFIDLIGTSFNGRAASNPIGALSYLKMKKAESEALIYANKAVRFGIAVKKDGAYYINERVMGSSIDQVAHMFRTDSDLFDGYIRKMVDDAEAADDKTRVGDKRFNPKTIPEDLKALIPVIAERTDKSAAAK